MADGGASARIAGAAAFVSMADGGVGARIAGAAAFVSMADKGASARIAGAAVAVRDLLVLRSVHNSDAQEYKHSSLLLQE
jgi:hypothetical protein